MLKAPLTHCQDPSNSFRTPGPDSDFFDTLPNNSTASLNIAGTIFPVTNHSISLWRQEPDLCYLLVKNNPDTRREAAR